jgi:uncharacterized protein
MNKLIESRREAVAELCRRYGVIQLEVFGSAVRQDFDETTSDIDLLVRFDDARAPGYADRYLEFAESMEALLGRGVDLVTQRSLRNPLLIRAIEPERETIYAA